MTGDADKRLRDHVRDISRKPTVVKTVDKVLFTGGVVWVGVTEFVILCYPEFLGLWYVATIIPLMGLSRRRLLGRSRLGEPT